MVQPGFCTVVHKEVASDLIKIVNSSPCELMRQMFLTYIQMPINLKRRTKRRGRRRQTEPGAGSDRCCDQVDETGGDVAE